MRNKNARRLRKLAGWKVGHDGMSKEITNIVREKGDQRMSQNPKFRLYKELKLRYKRGF